MIGQLCTGYELEHRRPLAGQPASPSEVTAVACTADVGTVAVATAAPWFRGHSELLLFTAGGGDPVRLRLPDDPRGVRVAELSFAPTTAPEGVLLATVVPRSGGCGMVAAWDTGSGEQMWTAGVSGWSTDAFNDEVAGLSCSADGARVAAGSLRTRGLVVADARTGRPVYDVGAVAYEDRPRGLGAVALDATGERLAFSKHTWSGEGISGPVALLDLVPGTETAVYGTGLRSISLAFHPAGKSLLAVGRDGPSVEARLIDPDAGPGEEGMRTVPLSSDGEARALWAADGPRALLRWPGLARVVDVITGAVLAEVDVSRFSDAAAVALAPDGRTLLTADPDGVRTHPVDPIEA